MNATAAQIIRQRDGLFDSAGYLAAWRASDTGMLRRRIRGIFHGTRGSGPTFTACNVQRRSGAPDYRLLIGHRPSDPDLACVFIGQDDWAPMPDEAWLETWFGLTACEARLASRLAVGWSLERIAASANTSITTARTHLGHVLAKTGTCRQADLVRLVLRSPALLCAAAMPSPEYEAARPA